jgi:hypothetical protein
MSITDPLLQTYRHDDLLVDARWVTWDLAVFEVRHEGVDGVVAVPRADLDSFVASLWDGRLDDELIRELHSPQTQRRRLADGDDVTEVAVYGGVKDPTRLVPPERNPRTGRVGGTGGPRGRNAKRSSANDGILPVPKKTPLLIGAAIVALILILAGTAVALSGGDDEEQDVAALDTTTTSTLLGGTSSNSAPPAEGFRGLYELTVTITSFETSEFGDRPPSPTFTSAWVCGDYRVIDSATSGSASPEPGNGNLKECFPDPRYEFSYFTPSFPIPDPDQESFTASTPFPVCGQGAADDWVQGIDVTVNGYGTDQITGTITSGYDVVSCPLDNGAEGIGYKMTGTFVGRLVDPANPPGLGVGAG